MTNFVVKYIIALIIFVVFTAIAVVSIYFAASQIFGSTQVSNQQQALLDSIVVISTAFIFSLAGIIIVLILERIFKESLDIHFGIYFPLTFIIPVVFIYLSFFHYYLKIFQGSSFSPIMFVTNFLLAIMMSLFFFGGFCIAKLLWSRHTPESQKQLK